MRKTEMSEAQMQQRSLFVDALSAAGWQGSNANRNFDEGLWVSPEASMTYGNPQVSLRLDFAFDDPRVLFYITAKNGKSLGLVFKCPDRLRSVLNTIVAMQDTLTPDNISEQREQLLAACPETFKISASGDKLTPIAPKRSGSR